MSYTLNENSFKFGVPYLDELLANEEDTLTWEVTDSRDFAYRLRQAIHAAKKLNYLKYADLLVVYKIKESGNNVTASKRFTATVIPVGIHRKVFAGISNLSGLITSVVANNHLTTLSFPDLELSEEDKEQLSKFCRAKNWAYHIERKELMRCQPMNLE